MVLSRKKEKGKGINNRHLEQANYSENLGFGFVVDESSHKHV